MTFTPFASKFNINDIVALKQSMASYKVTQGGTFSKGHKFKILSLYIAAPGLASKHYGVLQPVDPKANIPPYIYTMECCEEPNRIVSVEEVDLLIVEKATDNKKPIYARVEKDKTTYHSTPRKDAPKDKALAKSLAKDVPIVAKPAKKFALKLGGKR